jgi:hypothetical protein
VIRNSRFVAAIGLVIALGISALAFADGASENTSEVLGSITPSKLDEKKYKPVTFYSGVTTNTTHAVPGQQNAEKVTLYYPKNVIFDFSHATACTAPLAGTTTEQAKAACPEDSVIGSGTANANLGQGPQQVKDTVVTVFVTKKGKVAKTGKNGKAASGSGTLALHAYTPELGAANTQVVVARIVPKAGPSGFGPALIVDDAPDLGGDAFMLTKFDATIGKGTKAVLARCKSKTNKWHGIWIYDDGTKDEADLTTKCKQK